jgi:hypothetical protein
LLDHELMQRKVAQEKKLREAVEKNPGLQEVGKAWDLIAKAQKVRRNNIRTYTLFEAGAAFNTPLFGYARTLVRSAEEYAKPNEKRLAEYTDAGKKSLELRLFSEQPLYKGFEMVRLADSLTWLAEQEGYENPLVQQVLAGKSPRERATQLILNTKLFDVEERRRLYEGGQQAVNQSKDPLIQLVRQIDPVAREARTIIETQVEEPQRQGYDLIAQAKFAVEGTDNYPDATFTLRLAFGTVKGYEEEGKHIPFETIIGGLYERAKEHNYAYPFDLPERWEKRKNQLNLKTPFNFVSTADIIGGNSGSPVINRNAEVVGLIFDGNIQSLVLDFAYTDEQARAVSVHSQGILEGLRAVYQAERLVQEIRQARTASGSKE